MVCDHRNCSSCPNVYHMCNKTLGDATDWDEQTLALLALARPHLISGALRGVFLGERGSLSLCSVSALCSLSLSLSLARSGSL